jgi:hypothetical protein
MDVFYDNALIWIQDFLFFSKAQNLWLKTEFQLCPFACRVYHYCGTAHMQFTELWTNLTKQLFAL